MTICIAAIFDDGEGVALISDQMVTAHFPIGYEFEQGASSKITKIDGENSLYALVSGDMLSGNEMLNIARRDLAQKESPTGAHEFSEMVRAAYQTARTNSVVRTELEPRGLDMNSYYASHQRLAQNVVQIIDRALSQSDFGVDILVAGLSNDKFVVHTVHNPGVLTENTPLGYGAIGSGSPHAIYSLIEAGYSSSMKREEAVEIIKKAKERSQVAPGVGLKTELVVLPEGRS